MADKVPQVRQMMREMGIQTIWNAWLQRRKIAGAERSIQAVANFEQAVADLWSAREQSAQSKLGYLRAMNELERADEWFEVDNLNRENALLEAQNRNAKLRGKKEKREKIIDAKVVENEPDLTAEMMKELTKKLEEDYIQEKGGRANLTAEDKAYLQNLWQKCQEFIRENGL